MISLNRVVYALFGKSLGWVFRDQSRSNVSCKWENYDGNDLNDCFNDNESHIPHIWLPRKHNISPKPTNKSLYLRLHPHLRKILCWVDPRLCTKPLHALSPLHETQRNRYHDLVPSTIPRIHSMNVKWSGSQMQRVLLPVSRFSDDCAYAWPNYHTRVSSMYHLPQSPMFHALANRNPIRFEHVGG